MATTSVRSEWSIEAEPGKRLTVRTLQDGDMEITRTEVGKVTKSAVVSLNQPFEARMTAYQAVFDISPEALKAATGDGSARLKQEAVPAAT